MNTAEIHYRVVTIRERINQLEAELLAIEAELKHDAEIRACAAAQKGLAGAEQDLRALAALATMEDPELMFRLSLARTTRRAEVLLFPLGNNNAG